MRGKNVFPAGWEKALLLFLREAGYQYDGRIESVPPVGWLVWIRNQKGESDSIGVRWVDSGHTIVAACWMARFQGYAARARRADQPCLF